jgi:hypothetical protein
MKEVPEYKPIEKDVINFDWESKQGNEEKSEVKHIKGRIFR